METLVEDMKVHYRCCELLIKFLTHYYVYIGLPEVKHWWSESTNFGGLLDTGHLSSLSEA
jgi:hypothetical protein